MEKKIKILLVEDELIIADYMQECLQQFGYEVTGICISYNEAIEALSNAVPDIVLMDISLKGEKSGIDLAVFINREFQLPFVYITSHSDKATIDKAKQTLPYAYLIKPFSENDLYAAIETALMQYAAKKVEVADKESEEKPVIIKDGIFMGVYRRTGQAYFTYRRAIGLVAAFYYLGNTLGHVLFYGQYKAHLP